jgi:hypothetical protein
MATLDFGQNNFASPRTSYSFFKNTKNKSFLLQKDEEQILISSRTQRTHSSFFKSMIDLKDNETSRSSHQ